VFGTVTTNAKLQSLLSHLELGLLATSYAALAFWLAYAPVMQTITPDTGVTLLFGNFWRDTRREMQGPPETAIQRGS